MRYCPIWNQTGICVPVWDLYVLLLFLYVSVIQGVVFVGMVTGIQYVRFFTEI